MTPSPELRRRVLAMAGREVAPTRDQVRRWRARVFVSGTVASIALFVALGGMHQGGRTTQTLWISALGWAVVAAAATWVAFGARRGMLGPPTVVLVTASLFVAPLLAGWSRTFTGDEADAVLMIPRQLHVVCFVFTLVYSAVPLALMITLRRGTDPVHPEALGSVLGGAAGAWGCVLIDLHCPVTAERHVLLSHVMPVVALALAGSLLGRLLLGPKARARQNAV